MLYRRIYSWIFISGLLAGLSSSALAQPQYLQSFKAAYPKAAAIQSCNLCHTDPPQLNPFGIDYMKSGHSFAAIENLDSDGDGYTNIQEINAGTWPGDKSSHPTNNPGGNVAPFF